MYKAASPSLPEPVVRSPALPPLPGLLQRPLLPEDLQLREHAEAGSLRGGRTAGRTTSTPVAPTSSTSSSLTTLRNFVDGAAEPLPGGEGGAVGLRAHTRTHPVVKQLETVNRWKTKENTLTVTTRWRGKEETPSDL